jgi:hypothetical protein
MRSNLKEKSSAKFVLFWARLDWEKIDFPTTDYLKTVGLAYSRAILY